MTYTIIGRCDDTGRPGIGIATYSLAVGGYCPHYRDERSAALIVKTSDTAPGLDLRVDVHEDAVTELRGALEAYRPYVACYEMRRTDPDRTPAQEQWPPD